MIRPLRLLVATAILVCFQSPAPSFAASEGSVRAGVDAASRSARRNRLMSVRSWGYQLRLIDPAEVAASPFDMVVLDHAISANRRFVREYTRDEVRLMKSRPGGTQRLALAYLSIGEAERYRFYWQQDWYDAGRAPSWLSTANDRWDGNWRARFWEPGWQAHIFSGVDTYLARIKAQGFDGIYLDRADVYHELLHERPGARADMLRFIRDLAAAARRDDPAFLVVMQNAEELLADATLRATLDGLAKEDLLFGVEHDARPNPPAMVHDTLANLRRAKAAGLPVFLVEYLDDAKHSATASRLAAREGFVFLNGERSLGSLHNPIAPASVIDTPSGRK